MVEKIATVLITAPRKIGDPTFYTSIWAYNMEKLARQLGYNVITLKGDNVNYRNVNAAIERYRPRLYIHAGHGCSGHLTGQNECILTRKYSIDEMLSMEPEQLDRILNPTKLSGCGKDICSLNNDVCMPLCFNETNIHLLRDSIIYAVACNSSSGLGKCAIRYGVQSYVGYRDLLLFPVDQMRSQDIFGQVHLEFLRYLLTGYSVGEANDAMGMMEDTYIRLYRQIKWTALPMLWNTLHRDVLGDPDTTIY